MIKYKSGYKYQLYKDYTVCTPFFPKEVIKTDYITLEKTGVLKLSKGYAWNGVSGPVFDTKKNIRASLVHDVLYQLIRNEHLDVETDKDPADLLFKEMCIVDGTFKWIAELYYLALFDYGFFGLLRKKEVYEAP